MNICIRVDFGKITLICALWMFMASVFDNVWHKHEHVMFLISFYIKRIMLLLLVFRIYDLFMNFVIKFYKSLHL